jgi:HK97 family phage portal protein
MSLLSLFGMGAKQSLSPAPWDDYWYSSVGSQTTAGVRVDENVALNYSVCWAATRLLAGTAGWLPLNLYKRLPSGGASIDSPHRVHRLIHDQPNEDMGAMMFRSCGLNQQINWGNTFSEIGRSRGGFSEALYPIHASRIPKKNIVRENGRLVYYVNRPDGGPPDRIPQENMFHVPSIISDDGIFGKGVVTAARESIGKAMGTQRRGASALKNGGAPPLALKGGKFKDKAEREDYRRQINEIHSGPENAGKWLLLPPDAEVQMLGFNLKDCEFIESMQFDVEEMCRWYGVPPHLVQNLLRATFNNIEELGISFVKYSLIQWLKLWEQEIWRKLLTKEEQQTHYAKFVVDALERGNMASRTEANVKKFFNGHWTLNQWAEQEDENPVTETTVIDGQTVNLGDVRFVQQAMIPLSLAAKGPQPGAAQPTDAPPEDKTPPAQEPTGGDGGLSVTVAGLSSELDAIRQQLAGLPKDATEQLTAAKAAQKQLAAAMLNDVMARMVSLEINGVKRVAEKPSRFDVRLREFYDKHTETMKRSLASSYSAYLSAKAAEHDCTYNTDHPGYLLRLVNEHVRESLRQLDALCDCTADQLAAKVDECVSKWHEERATVTV